MKKRIEQSKTCLLILPMRLTFFVAQDRCLILCVTLLLELLENLENRTWVTSNKVRSAYGVMNICRLNLDHRYSPRTYMLKCFLFSGKAVVHEWAQLRWGLREESNFKNGGETCTVLEDWWVENCFFESSRHPKSVCKIYYSIIQKE